MFHIITIILLLGFAGECAYGRNKALADSCIWILENEAELSPARRSELLLLAIHNTSDYRACLELSEKLILAAEEADNAYYLFYGNYEKGQALTFLNNSEEALPFLQKSLRIALVNDLKKEIGFTNYRISDVYRRRDNYEQAIHYIKTALLNFLEINETLYISNTFYQIGNIYYQTHQNDSAKSYYMKACRSFEEQGYSIGVSYCYGNLGAIYGRLHQPDSARIFLNKAITSLEKLKDDQALTTFYLYAVKNELSVNNFERATEYAQRALTLANKVQNAEIFRDVYEQLAILHSKTGDYTNAFRYQQMFYTLRDSLVNMDVITRMANMQTEFEVGQKQAEVDKLSAVNLLTTRVATTIAVSLLLVLLLLLMIYHDYRKKKSLNKSLERQKEELSIRKKELEMANDSKDRLFSIISHDLRGPVGALGSLADMISLTLSENHNPREAQDLAVSMAEASRQVEFLLNNLLHWSVNQQNLYNARTEIFELNGFTNGVMKVYTQIAKAKNIQLILKSSSDTLYIEGDPNCWGTIIRNLINNSLKFTHTGGKVQLNVKYTDNHVYLEVTDTGVGMTRDQINRLFVFSGTSREWGTQNERGQGLGLCLVHDFVKINNGHIEVDSQPGAGSTFRIIMPAKRVSAKHLIVAG